MDEVTLREILARLPDRQVFRYFKDRYALMLLSYACRDGRNLRDMKASKFRGLFDKPLVRSMASRGGAGWQHRAYLAEPQHARSYDFVVTFGAWGDPDLDESEAPDWRQVSRPGMNLVLHLNFPLEHDARYSRLIRPGLDDPFVNSDHPHAESPLNTLAWARVDLDFEAGEALIEEVQSDWVRRARDTYAAAIDVLASGDIDSWYGDAYTDAAATPKGAIRYYRDVLLPYVGIWHEAVLAATLRTLVDELGITRIFYHTVEGGEVMKSIPGEPPRSLYSKLPRRFCFTEQEAVPSFLASREMPLFMYTAFTGPFHVPVPAWNNREDAVRFQLLELARPD